MTCCLVVVASLFFNIENFCVQVILLYSNLGGLADCPEEVFSQLADHLLEGLNRWASYIAMHVPTGGH
jgi:hypothetical protein